MCGIAGVVHFDGRAVLQEEVKRMTDRMVNRGPDDEGFFVHGRVGIGMRRLSIIDIASGHQPIANERETLWVVMNGEIYNYVELRRELQLLGHTFRTASDTEVLVHGYEEDGFEFVHKLNGMFAFALYDRQKEGLWVVRDRLGIKPLYYGKMGEHFFFSSDLTTFPHEMRGEIDQRALIAYAGLGYVPTPSTIYRGIQKLPPGHWLWIQDGCVEMRQYWEVLQFQTAPVSEKEAEQKLTELLHDAVRLQLRSDVPLGMMLSGGVDSSAVTAIAATAVSRPVNTFTINFSHKSGEDGAYARTVAERYTTCHEQIDFRPSDLLTGLDEVVKIMDEPIADSAIVPTYLIAKFARGKGVTVMLSGAGGDELFGGYRRHFPPRIGSPSWCAQHLPYPLRRFVGNVWSLLQPYRGLRVHDPGVAYLSGVFGADLGFYRETFKDGALFEALMGTLQQSAAPLAKSERHLSYQYRRMHFDLRQYLVDNILALTDKATMGVSVEGRVPLLDHRLVEYAFSLPSSRNLLAGEPKGLFRQVLKPYLPEALLNRRKEGFNAPVSMWMGAQFFDEVKKELQELLVPALSDILDRDALMNHLRTPPAQSYLASTLFSLYVFNRWARYHL